MSTPSAPVPGSASDPAPEVPAGASGAVRENPADSSDPALAAPTGAPVRSAAEQETAARLPSERIVYRIGQLDDNAPLDPFELFTQWMEDAFARRDHEGDLPEPTAMVLATVVREADGSVRPTSRTLLLKSFDRDGFVFYTNRDSDKGHELAAEPNASILAQWLQLQRQVRIEGAVVDVSDEEASAYFASRPRGSQLEAWTSHQSRPIASRAALEAEYAEVEERFEGQEVPRPPHWGGYRLRPRRIEFWQGRANRLHDRLLFTLQADGTWTRERLQP